MIVVKGYVHVVWSCAFLQTSPPPLPIQTCILSSPDTNQDWLPLGGVWVWLGCPSPRYQPHTPTDLAAYRNRFPWYMCSSDVSGLSGGKVIQYGVTNALYPPSIPTPFHNPQKVEQEIWSTETMALVPSLLRIARDLFTNELHAF